MGGSRLVDEDLEPSAGLADLADRNITERRSRSVPAYLADPEGGRPGLVAVDVREVRTARQLNCHCASPRLCAVLEALLGDRRLEGRERYAVDLYVVQSFASPVLQSPARVVRAPALREPSCTRATVVVRVGVAGSAVEPVDRTLRLCRSCNHNTSDSHGHQCGGTSNDGAYFDANHEDSPVGFATIVAPKRLCHRCGESTVVHYTPIMCMSKTPATTLKTRHARIR